MSVSKILFHGCSYTEGIGLNNTSQNPMHWCNVFASETPALKDSKIHNIGKSGYVNEYIFRETADALLTDHYDYAFVCWTAYPRMIVYPGFEEYEVRRNILPNTTHDPVEHKGNDLFISAKKFSELKDLLLLLYHDHYEILKLISYVNILLKIGKIVNTNVYFVNNICHWDKNFFEQDKKLKNQTIKPSLLTDYTNKLLISDNRDDDQVGRLFKKMFDDYRNHGSIRSESWLNIYNSFHSQYTDTGNDNLHPGPISHQNYGKYLSRQFLNLINNQK